MKIRKILNVLNKADMALSEIFGDVFSRKTAWRDILRPGYESRSVEYRNKEDEWREERKKFLNLMRYLVRQGLVKKTGNDGWKITREGREYLKKLIGMNPPTIRIAPKEMGRDKMKVVIFDIPEIEKKRRVWIRRSLKNLGFNMIQKSVWMGETRLPQDFFERLAEFKLTGCVHIFEVNKMG